MSAIKQAITKLDTVVGKLEGSLGSLEKALGAGGGQPDMFSYASSRSGGSVDKAEVIKRLDNAIKKVEAVLKDGKR